MKLLKIGWVGTRTEHAEAMADFFGRVLGLSFRHRDEVTWVYQLPDGSKAEVFGPSENTHFTTGPVVEFLVETLGQPSRSFGRRRCTSCPGPSTGEARTMVPGCISGLPTATSNGTTQGRDLRA
jgi:hypothetical protein